MKFTCPSDPVHPKTVTDERMKELEERIVALEAAFMGPTFGYFWLSQFSKPEYIKEAIKRVEDLPR